MGVRLTAGQAGHDRVQITGHRMGKAVGGRGRCENASRTVGLHGDEPRRMITEGVEQVSDDGTGQRPHADLQENMGGPEPCQGHLIHCFHAHGRVTLHDPEGDLGVAFPRCVLDHIPAIFLRPSTAQPDGVIVVEVGYDHSRSVGADVLNSGAGGTLGHVDDRMLVKLLRGPGNTPSVIAVCGRREGDLPDALPHLIGDKIGEIHVVRAHCQFLTHEARRGITTT